MENFNNSQNHATNYKKYDENIYYYKWWFAEEPIIYNEKLGTYMLFNKKSQNWEYVSEYNDDVDRSKQISQLQEIEKIFTSEMMHKYWDNSRLQDRRNYRNDQRQQHFKKQQEQNQQQKSDQQLQSENLKSQL